MNDLLQKHGCSNVFTVPEGLKELMSDIAREVLREQPKDVYDFITNYLSVLLITREHGVMAVKILEELCDCRPSVSEHLLHLGLHKDTANTLAQVIKDQIESFEARQEKEKLKESDILKKIMMHVPLDEELAAKVCQIARNAYKDYMYKKTLMEQSTTMQVEEPWQVAAERTLAIYKKTKPSLNELHRASERIQAAYRGYHVRRNLLKHLKPKKKRGGPKEALPGPPLDIAGSREIDLGRVIDIKVYEDDINAMFEEHANLKLGLHYDPMMTITNVEEAKSFVETDKLQIDRRDLDENARNYLKIQTDAQILRVDAAKRASRCASPSHGIMRHDLINRVLLDNYNDDVISRDYNPVEYRTVGTPARKISFSTVSPELIPNKDDFQYPDDEQEVQEAIQEVLDDIGPNDYQDIPEDLPDGGVEADDYTPVASASSLVSTDVEDLVNEEKNLDKD